MCCSILAHIFDALKTLVQLTRHLLEKTLLFHAYEFKNKPRKTKNVLTSMHWHLIQFMSTQLRMDFYEFKELISVACYLDLKSFIILWAKIKYTTIMQLKRLVIMAKVLTVLYNLYVIGFCSTTPRMKMWYMCSGMWPRISHLWLYCISLLKLFFFSGREWLDSRMHFEYQHFGPFRPSSSCLRMSKTFTLWRAPI